jgi:hyperosmotically inducible protein
MKKILFVMMLLLFSVTVFGCASLTGRTAGEIVDDSAITTAINAKIIKDPDLHYLKINVNSEAGNVTLSGFVRDKAAEDRLIQYAKETKGVKSVTSNLKIQP